MSDPRMCDLVSAHALGALDDEELTAFEAHLAGCETCRREIEQTSGVLDALATGIPEVAPPPELKAKVMQAALAANAAAASADDDSAPGGSGEDRLDLSRRRGSAARFGRVIPWLAAAGFGFALWAGEAYRRTNRLANTLEDQLADARGVIDGLQAAQASRDSMLAALTGPVVETATLTTTGSQPQVRLFWNRSGNSLLVTAFDLPAPAPGRTYQLWGLAPDASPVSLGTFETGPDGRAVVLQTIAPGISYAQSAVTDEPAGGSPQPTTQPFLVGPWSSASP